MNIVNIKIGLGALLGLLLFTACHSTGREKIMSRWITTNSEEIESTNLSVLPNETYFYAEEFKNFKLTGLVKTQLGGCAGLWFHTDRSGDKGYEVLFCNGISDGSRKTGSLSGIRNLYKSIAVDREWFPFEVIVRGRNISILINESEVVCYTEPEHPYRTEPHQGQRLSEGGFLLKGYAEAVDFKELKVIELSLETCNPKDTLPAAEEQTDAIIRLQQANFPVIDYHVHLKGWSKEQAQATSMNYGIEYGIAPNCGIGFPITDDAGVAAYRDSTQYMPFFFGMQGEGREWVTTFSETSRSRFDYVFTDALTFADHKGRRTRLWINEEVFIDIPQEQYMDVIVDRIVEVLQNEPIDIYVNPCMLPEVMAVDYDKLWTPKRIDRVVEQLKERSIALEINARYRIPNFETIRVAKAAGLKFSFGTNNGTPEIGKLEYCIEAIDSCGLTPEDLWFPAQRKEKSI